MAKWVLRKPDQSSGAVNEANELESIYSTEKVNVAAQKRLVVQAFCEQSNYPVLCLADEGRGKAEFD